MILYRAIQLLLAPLVALRFVAALLRRRETVTTLRERLALDPPRPRPASRLWLHGASLGELTAARRLIEMLLERAPGLELVVTSNTVPGRDMVAGWGLERVRAHLAPLDYPRITRRFLDRWQPRACVSLENELWPVRLALAAEAGLPVVVVGGRMSARSARGWSRLPGLRRRALGAITLLLPLDAANARRLAGLGLETRRIGAPLNLKAEATTTPPAPAELARLRPAFPHTDTVLAASTHPGDEALILEAFALARRSRPALRLILAPRHPARAGAILRLIARAGLTAARRSDPGSDPTGCDVYLADTIGEMALFHSLAAQTVMGGSFSDLGGHSPLEAVQCGSVVVHGPDVANHADAYRALAEADAAFRVEDASGLAALLARSPDPQALEATARRARAALEALRPGRQVLEALADRLAGYGTSRGGRNGRCPDPPPPAARV